jgi:hypothetical protein
MFSSIQNAMFEIEGAEVVMHRHLSSPMGKNFANTLHVLMFLLSSLLGVFYARSCNITSSGFLVTLHDYEVPLPV